MRPEKLLSFLTASIKNGRRILIKGMPGIGKTDIVDQARNAANADMVLMHPAISDPTDFKGMPALTAGGKEAHFLPFGDLSRLCKANSLTVAFLDDIGQAAPAVQAALMQLILARSVNGTHLSPHVVFIGATNDTTHMAGVSGMIEPLKSRWDTIVQLEVNVDDWSLWAFDHDMPADLIAYLRSYPQSLCDFKPTKEIKNGPCPRTWASVGKWVNDGVTDHEVLAGAVGEAEAVKYSAFRIMQQHLPSLDDILLNPATAPLPPDTITVKDATGKDHTYPGAALNVSVSCALASKASPKNLERILTYSNRLDKRFELLLMKDALRRDKTIAASQPYVRWAVQNQGLLS